MLLIVNLTLLVLGYLLMRRIRWRIARFILLIPLFAASYFVISFYLQWNAVRNAPTPEELEAQLLDSAFVEQGDLVVTVSSTGAVLPARQLPLSFQLSGRVEEIMFEEGDAVETGDVIARLDDDDFEQLVADAQIAVDLQQAAYDVLTSPPREVDIAVAEAAVAAAQAQVGSAIGTAPSSQQEEISRLQSEIARNRLWQAQLQRDTITASTLDTLPDIPNIQTGNEDLDDILNENLGDAIGGINEAIQGLNASQIATIESQRQQAESGLQQLELGVQIADAQYGSTLDRGPDTGSLAAANAARLQAEIALENLLNPSPLQIERSNVDLRLSRLTLEQARENLAQTALVAPFDGIIAQNDLTVGQLPPQGIAVLLMDTSSFYVDLPIDETDIVNIKIGQRVTITVDALPDLDVTGQVERVAFTPTVIGQLVTYNVRVRVDDAFTDALRVGMSVTADIIVDERADVVIVPNRFVRIDRLTQEAFVTVQTEPGRYREILVLLGSRNERFSEVITGLEPGQRVVLLPRSDDDDEGGGFF